MQLEPVENLQFHIRRWGVSKVINTLSFKNAISIRKRYLFNYKPGFLKEILSVMICFFEGIEIPNSN